MLARREEGWMSSLSCSPTLCWAEERSNHRWGSWLITYLSQQCERQLPEQQLCRLPEYVVQDPQGWVAGNLSAWGDGAAGFTLPGFRFLTPPHPPSANLIPLKPEEHAIKFEVSVRDRGRDSWGSESRGQPTGWSS